LRSKSKIKINKKAVNKLIKYYRKESWKIISTY
jgi:hypothetical protein